MPSASQTGAARERRSRFRFTLFSDVIGELRKVVWLSRREAAYLTLLVIIVSVGVGLLLAGLDLGFTRLIDKVFIGG
jgi:preprotein translocase SecE subunit